MGNLLSAILSLIVFYGCNALTPGDLTVTQPDRSHLTNPEFYSYQDTFENEYRNLTHNLANIRWIPIRFEKEEIPNRLGTCWTYPNGFREITINEVSWNRLSTDSREMLILHELGHCALGKPHFDEVYRYFSVSIMNTYSFAGSHYSRFRDGYLQQLFLGDDRALKASIDQYWGAE